MPTQSLARTRSALLVPLTSGVTIPCATTSNTQFTQARQPRHRTEGHAPKWTWDREEDGVPIYRRESKRLGDLLKISRPGNFDLFILPILRVTEFYGSGKGKWEEVADVMWHRLGYGHGGRIPMPEHWY